MSKPKSGEEVKDGGSSSSPPGNQITLLSLAGESFVVDRDAIALSNLVKVMMDDDPEANDVPLSLVQSSVLAKVIEYCTHHKTEPMNDLPRPIKHGKTLRDYVQPWYADFIEALDKEMLFDLIMAANYMDVKPLMDATCARAGLMLINKTPQEIKALLNIEKDFSPAVEQQLRDEIKWTTFPN